jgi:hypothetical protein
LPVGKQDVAIMLFQFRIKTSANRRALLDRINNNLESKGLPASSLASSLLHVKIATILHLLSLYESFFILIR